MFDSSSPDVPAFGVRVSGAAYIPRPSVYVCIENRARQIAIVRTSLGVFLPGGGVEAGESLEQALHREVREECGLTIHLHQPFAHAVQLTYSEMEEKHFEKICTFYTGVERGLSGGEMEADHELLWVSLDEAVAMLKYECHRWAVQQISGPLP